MIKARFFIVIVLTVFFTGSTLAAETRQDSSNEAPADGKLEFGIGPGSQGSEQHAAADATLELEIAKDEYSDAFEETEDDADYLEETPDPYEKFNRRMYRFNDYLYENVMEPVAGTYADIAPEGFRKSMKNFFRNLGMPVRLVSSIIQGDGEKSGRTVVRFMLNTVFGFGGLFDVAKMKRVDEDFDQALAYHGVKTGPYFVWPFFGPATLRGTFGMAGDTAMNPAWLLFSPGIPGALGMGTGKKINDVSLELDVKEEVEEIAIDEYTSVRDLYLQHRRGKEKE